MYVICTRTRTFMNSEFDRPCKRSQKRPRRRTDCAWKICYNKSLQNVYCRGSVCATIRFTITIAVRATIRNCFVCFVCICTLHIFINTNYYLECCPCFPWTFLYVELNTFCEHMKAWFAHSNGTRIRVNETYQEQIIREKKRLKFTHVCDSIYKYAMWKICI